MLFAGPQKRPWQIAAPSLLIAGLLWQWSKKRKAEAVLHESEQRFRVMSETVSRKLIEALERERGHIARELHDDICQRLALLALELDQVEDNSSESPSINNINLELIRKHCSELATDVQSLSHQLHSSILDHLGLTAAVRAFCKEFSRRHEVNVVFTAMNIPKSLPNNISLCLLRIAQEALQNAVKHSGTDQFTVTLTATPANIQIDVSDKGTGFDIEHAKRNGGLGLVSMRERVHLVRGVFSVQSKPGIGTRVLAVIPCITENKAPTQHEASKEFAHMQDVA